MSLFARQVERHRDKDAVRFAGRGMTFGEIDRLSNRIARRILEVDGEVDGAADGAGNRPVAALLTEGIIPPAALLGALKAGKCHVPLDAANNPARLERIIKDSTARTVVTESGLAEVVARVAPGLAVVELDRLAGVSDAGVETAHSGEDLALIVYTSGSTGEPKGVVNTLEQLSYTVSELSREFDPTSDDRVSVIMSFAFAGGLKPMLRAVLAGATVCLGGLGAFERLAQVLAEERITYLSTSPSVLRHLALVARREMLPDLRMVYAGHEPLFRRDLERFREVFGDLPLRNTLGTTETSTFRTYVTKDAASFEGDTVPVGHALGDMQVLLLDENRRPVPQGEAGEIAVKSPHISAGYWRSPELTAQRFVNDPADGGRMYLTGDMGKMLADGCLIHLGRRDFQTKIRAFRVEPVEVESALREHPSVTAAVVLAREDKSGENRLIAYYVPRPGAAPTASDLRKHLSARLPDYMVPSAFVALDAFPLNVNGKLDRSALPVPPRTRATLAAAFVAPRTPVEDEIAALWRQVLDVDEVGVDDTFFELGGQSILAVQMLARIFEKYQVDIPVLAFFAAPTVGLLSLEVTRRMAEGQDAEDVARLVAQLEADEAGAGTP